jgi:L-xylulokinase
VLRAAGVRFDSAALSGGGARSEVWPQMFADILGFPVSVPVCREAGALGAAIAAAVGARRFPGLPQAVHAMTTTRARFVPDPGMAAHYEERYRTYGMLTEAMKPVWARMAGAHGGT